MSFGKGKGRIGIFGTVWLSSAFFVAIMVITAGASVSTAAQVPNSKSKTKAKDDASHGAKVNAQQLARDVLTNEVKAEQSDHTLWRFRKAEWKNGQEKLYDVIETRNGDVSRLLAANGKPLNAEQQRAEDARIQKLMKELDELKKQQQTLKADGDKETELLKMLPDALQYRYAGREGDLVKLTFTPNPKFHASSREAEVFHHMSGVMVLNVKVKRLAEMRGRLTSEVKFFGGILGHLDKGGTFAVKQADVSGTHWDMTLLDTELNGKALFFKTIAVHEKRLESNYQRVPNDITLQQAAQILTKGAAESAATTSKKAQGSNRAEN
ncbi:MAG TPA: hypothetical protein VGU63_04045 [Candidatus Acidoferrales bacterium]|nr:hypothetical protein [Candidatus Acidoferrales bacterium]